MKNLFIAVTLVLTAASSKAQTDRAKIDFQKGTNEASSKFCMTTSPDLKTPVSLDVRYKDDYVPGTKATIETHPADSAKADPKKAYALDSAESETVKQFTISERSASNYLVGTWTVKDTSNHIPPMSLTFDDSMHVKLLLAKEDAAHLTYSVDKYRDHVVLRFDGRNSRNVKTHMYWFIKVLDNKTIEAEQPLYSPKSYKWNDAIAITVVKQS
jgi:hypothetical protein